MQFPGHLTTVIAPVHKRGINSLSLIGDRLIVANEARVLSLPRQYCSLIANCQQCVAMRDAHCAWSRAREECMALDITSGFVKNKQKDNLKNVFSSSDFKDEYYQNVITGREKRCPNVAEVAFADGGKRILFQQHQLPPFRLVTLSSRPTNNALKRCNDKCRINGELCHGNWSHACIGVVLGLRHWLSSNEMARL